MAEFFCFFCSTRLRGRSYSYKVELQISIYQSIEHADGIRSDGRIWYPPLHAILTFYLHILNF